MPEVLSAPPKTKSTAPIAQQDQLVKAQFEISLIGTTELDDFYRAKNFFAKSTPFKKNVKITTWGINYQSLLERKQERRLSPFPDSIK